MDKKTETFNIEGMSCDHCVRAVREALDSVEGVLIHDVEIGKAKVTYDDWPGSREKLVAAVEDAGYGVH